MGDTALHIIGNRRLWAIFAIIGGVSILALTAHAVAAQDSTEQALSELHSQLEAAQVSKHSLLKVQTAQAEELRKTTESIATVNKNITDLKGKIDLIVTGDTGTGALSFQ